jgi:hypothetical protein
MVLGWVPFKIVSDSPALHSRWLLLLKIEISSIVHCCFSISHGLIWFSGFRGEDLNVIFYQNMPNLHNRYKSAERKISQKNPEYMLNCSLPCSCSKNLSSFWLILKQQWTIEEISIFGRDGPWVGPFQHCVRQPRLSFKMAAVTKNRNFFNCPLLL